MSTHQRFALPTLEALTEELRRLGLNLPIASAGEFSVFTRPLTIAGHGLRNRFVAQPMEGVDALADGSPRDLTTRRYKRFAAGGSAILWFEAVAVVPEGRSNPRQLMLTPANLDAYKRLVEETRAAAPGEVLLLIQLTHSGRYSKPDGTPCPVIAQNNPELDKALHLSPDYAPISDDALDRLQDRFVETAKLAEKAGFDGVDMKAVHGYLVAELLGGHTRPGKYGGSFENRTRFLRECIEKMRHELTNTFATARFTAMEPSAPPYGWGVSPDQTEIVPDLGEPLELTRQLAALGAPLLNVSIGYPRYQPHWNRPHDNSLVGAPPPPEHPLEGIARFQAIVREIQQAAGDVPVATAALGWLRQWMPHVAAGLLRDGWCQLIGQGRGVFAYPDSVNEILASGTLNPRRVCTTCSMCSQIMKDGAGMTGCVIRDKPIYGPELQKGRAAAKAKGLP